MVQLNVTGPFEVLARVPGWSISLVAARLDTSGGVTVWSRRVVTRVNLDDVRRRCPGVADGFKGGLPTDGFEAVEVGIVERFDGCVLDCPVHALGLTVGRGVIREGCLP